GRPRPVEQGGPGLPGGTAAGRKDRTVLVLTVLGGPALAVAAQCSCASRVGTCRCCGSANWPTSTPAPSAGRRSWPSAARSGAGTVFHLVPNLVGGVHLGE